MDYAVPSSEPSSAAAQPTRDTPYITLTPTLSTTSPSFTSPTPPQLTTTLLLHNSPLPITIRTRETPILHPQFSTVLVDPATGQVRRPKSATPYFSGHSLRFCRANRGGFVTLYPGQPHSITSSFRPEGAKPGTAPHDALSKPRGGLSLETLDAARAGDPRAAELTADDARKSQGPFGIDGCMVRREYVLKVKEGMKVVWWRYGEVMELLNMSEEKKREREREWEREGKRVGKGERNQGLGSERGYLEVRPEEGKEKVTFRVVE